MSRRRSRDERGPWYLLTGLIIGLVLGLVYAWIVQPLEYVDTAPASLRADFKDQYRLLIASAYAANGDLVRAKARLELLQDEDVYRTLAEQAQRTLAEQGTASQARALGLLAIALGQGAPGPGLVITLPQPTGTNLGTEATPFTRPTATAGVTWTPLPTLNPIQTTPAGTSTTEGAPAGTLPPTLTGGPTQTTAPTATPGGPFTLLSQEKVCTQALPQPLIQIEAANSQGQPVPGVLVIVTWQGGEERFYTGLKIEKGMGYADFVPTPGVIYTLRLGETGQAVGNLSAVQCTASDGATFWGAWLLKFVQN